MLLKEIEPDVFQWEAGDRLDEGRAKLKELLARAKPNPIFGGRWPPEVATAPPSGPMTATVTGTAASKAVTSSADISLDPKPVHALDLSGLSLITPNRKEAFELAGLPDESPHSNPLTDATVPYTERNNITDVLAVPGNFDSAGRQRQCF